MLQRNSLYQDPCISAEKEQEKKLPSWHLTLVYDSIWNSEQRTEEWDVTKSSTISYPAFKSPTWRQAGRFTFACIPERQVPLLVRDPRAPLCSLFSDQETVLPVFVLCVCFCFVFVWRFLFVCGCSFVFKMKAPPSKAGIEKKKSICQSFQWLECLLLPICNNC